MSTTITQYIGHQFQLNSVPYSLDSNTRINIKKRHEHIFCKTLTTRDNINLAYVMGEDITPNNNLVISDRSTALVQNRVPSDQAIQTASTKTIILNVDKFLATDQFTSETPSKEATPLFYVHQLINFNSDLANFANMTLLSVEFADHNFNQIALSEYLLDTDLGALYNNIENTYDEDTGTTNVLFVKYTVKTVSGSTQTINIYRELISNSQVFEQADYDDLDEEGNIITGRKRYLIEELPGGQFFQITMPIGNLYAYRETLNSRLRIISPVAADIRTPWYVGISNGGFITSLQVDNTSYVNYKYYIAEFNSQTFTPYPPYKLQIEQAASYITNNLIKVPKNVVYNSALGLFLDVIIKDKNKVLKYVYTNDQDKIGTLYSGSIYYNEGILSVDEFNGFIELLDDIRSDDNIYVSYYTEESEYEFTYIDLNPVNNLTIQNHRLVIYIAPETYTTGTLQQTLHYLLIDSLGRITYSSQAAEEAIDIATQKLVGEDFWPDGTPRRIFYYDKTSTASGLLCRTNSGVNLEFVEQFSFIDKYTVNSVLLTSNTMPSGLAGSNYMDNSRFLLLGDVTVGDGQSPDTLTTFDVRVRGGGIKQENLTEALEQNARVSWYWDLPAQRPYPGVGAFLVEVPQTILQEHDGRFTEDQIVDIMEKHMKMGGYAILSTYGIDPAITECITTSGEVSLIWPSYGPSIQYNVYLSNTIKTGFNADNSSLIFCFYVFF